MRTCFRIALLTSGLAAAVGGVSNVSASAWRWHHPRRTQVNHRLALQNARITRERREGEISHSQAQNLRSQDHGVRAQERSDAAANNGRITGAEQQQLNQQENAVSAQIGR
jgi:hypothetical protein